MNMFHQSMKRFQTDVNFVTMKQIIKQIYAHMKFVHRNAKKLQCHLCEFQASKKYDYHIEGMHEKTTLQCDQC